MSKRQQAPGHKTEVKQETVAIVAREILEKAGGDVRKATELMERRVRESRALRDALTEPLIAAACYDAVSAQLRKARHKVWNPPVYSGSTGEPQGQRSRVEALAQSNLMMFQLPGGKPIAKATLTELLEASEFWTKQGRDMMHKGRWLSLVAARVPADKYVADALTEDDLRSLKAEARDV